MSVFNKTETGEIREAIEHLETNTSGELLVYVCHESDYYHEACWKLAAFFGFIAAACFGMLSFLWHLPVRCDVLMVSLLIAMFIVLGYVLPFYIPTLRIWLTDNLTIEDRAIERAKSVFLEKEVFRLPNRAGILLYVSRLEHEVVVLGDEGINQKVSLADWQSIVEELIETRHRDDLAHSIVDAVQKCESLLVKAGFTPNDDSTNYLPDEVLTK